MSDKNIGDGHHVVLAEEADTRLDRWIKRYYPYVNHGSLEKALRKGLIRVQDKKATSSQRLQEGQSIMVSRFIVQDTKASIKPPAPKTRISQKDIKSLHDSILYQDDEIIVLNKPSGLAVQGGSKILISVDAMLDELRFGYDQRPKLVHRLDKDTSGILLIARTAASAAKLTDAFRTKTIQKTYWAIVVGTPGSKSGEIRLPITKTKNADGYERITMDTDNSKPALTLYTVIKAIPRSVSWLEMTPVTGKMHQLRVHAESLGTPILGDGKYGGKSSFISGVSTKLHLHAQTLVLPAGIAKKRLFTAPLPPHMKETFEFFGFPQKSAEN